MLSLFKIKPTKCYSVRQYNSFPYNTIKTIKIKELNNPKLSSIIVMQDYEMSQNEINGWVNCMYEKSPNIGNKLYFTNSHFNNSHSNNSYKSEMAYDN